MTAAVDITSAQRKTLLALLRRFIPGVAVWAYGSRVKWTARPNSDLDLVAFTTPAQRTLVSELKEAFAESNLPFLVDLHIWDEVPARFHEIIRKEYVVLQEEKQPENGSSIVGEWGTGTLGDLADLIMGQSPSGETCNETGVGMPLLNGPTEFGGYHPHPVQFTTDPRKLAEPGDLLFCVRGSTTGRMNWSDQQYAIGRGIAAIRPKHGQEYRYFVRAVIDSTLPGLLATATGSTFPNVSREQLRDVECLIPPLPEQKTIAHILGTLDDKIELNRRMNTTLEAMARALFQSWFVDFDPARAKLDGRKPAGLDAATAALFPAHFQESPLGHIPQGWEVTTLGECIGFRSGFSFKSNDWQESGVPVVKIGSVKPGIIDLSQVSYVSAEIAQQAARYRLSVGDMLIGMTGYVGEVGLVPPTDNLPLLNQRVGKFVLPKPGTESLPFWYCTTRQPEFRAFVEARSHGTAQANVSGEAIMEFSLVVPPAGILDAFNRDCRPLLDRILTNHAESSTLATLRDVLLPKLISGEFRLPTSMSERAQQR